jgi:hypothetical protein
MIGFFRGFTNSNGVISGTTCILCGAVEVIHGYHYGNNSPIIGIFDMIYR